ncbi:DUF6473 family protein [Primorskyibacter sp. S87]|uniref:DUF6473 family protein n=1 Tax=Primorskyibacter sp. S87 TaxID=3415126 RepID=UPI003C7C0BD3
MSYHKHGAVAPEQEYCAYGNSKLRFRGPKRSLTQPYVAFVGGTETYGKFVERPFVDLVETELGQVCINLGSVDSGLDTFVQEAELLRIAQGAELVVLQIPAAQNLSNRLYRVHPRRNDRFLAASPSLKAIYPEVDFTEFHFNKHMLGALRSVSDERFQAVREELRAAWVSRMRLLLRTIDNRTVLLWLKYQDDLNGTGALGADPLLVQEGMLEELKFDACKLIRFSVRAAGESGDLSKMVFGPMQAPAASHIIGPATHAVVADTLVQELRPLL